MRLCTPPPPPIADTLPSGTRLVAGLGHATILPDMDFETYSAAGYRWDDAAQKWLALPHAPQGKRGLKVVGTANYAQHSSTQVISFWYDLKDGRGRRFWRPHDPACPPPHDLFGYIAAGGIIEAHKSSFEWWIWNRVCVPKYGWPPLPIESLRCSMSKAQAHALPGALENISEVLNLRFGKNTDGKRLLNKFSVPRNPTQKDPRVLLEPHRDPIDGPKLYAYNERDIIAECESSSQIPDLAPEELDFWLDTQRMNARGVQIDVESVKACISIIDQAAVRYDSELYRLTGGRVESASKLPALKEWLHSRGVHVDSLDADALDSILAAPNLPADCRRALQIRALAGSASIKKLYTLSLQVTAAGRVHDLFNFHGGRTGRDTASDAQPQNLPKSGPDVYHCHICLKWFGEISNSIDPSCLWCGVPVPLDRLKALEWNHEAAADALEVIATGSFDAVALFFGDPLAVVSGCLRGLFIAAPGHDLLCSDYNAIEAVGAAALANEEWRIEVFRTHGKIYEASASAITGIPFNDFLRRKKETGQHLPERGKIGKVAELASGYGGWVGAWLAFGAGDFFTEPEIKKHILAWRAASPRIVEMWGDQHRGLPWNVDYRPEFYGLEGCAVQAVLFPGRVFSFTPAGRSPSDLDIAYFMRGDVLYCRLPSGRHLTYHKPRLAPNQGRNRDEFALSFEGWNTNPKMGPKGWVRMWTYGGKLFENVVQAVCRDLLRDAVRRCEKAGYRIVLRVHDELVAEVPTGRGSVEELETLMMVRPAWAADWPIKASGGWRGKRYRKD